MAFEWTFDPVFAIPLAELDMTVRLRRALKKKGLVYVGDASLISEAEFLATPGVGKETVKELKDLLNLFGCAFQIVRLENLKGWPDFRNVLIGFSDRFGGVPC